MDSFVNGSDGEMDSRGTPVPSAAAPTHALAAAVGSKRRRGDETVGDAAGADFGAQPAVNGGGSGSSRDAAKRRRVDSEEPPPAAAGFSVWVKPLV